MTYSPDLPLDVARLLFEAAAWADRSTAHSLTLVSKDVHQWIEPILYNDIPLDTPSRVFTFAVGIVARNDPAFFPRTVKILTIGSFDSEHFPLSVSDSILDSSMIVILAACTGIERFAFWTAATVHIRHELLWQRLQPTHVSLIAGEQANTLPLLADLSPFLTHIHLDFAAFRYLSIYNSVNLWPTLFKESPRLTHLHLSGTGLETLRSQDLHPAFDAIVSVLPQTLARLMVCAISLRAYDSGAHIPVQPKTLRADPRVVFILPLQHALDVIEELQPHGNHRDVYFTAEDIHCERFSGKYLHTTA